MLRNYFLVTLRNLLKNRLYSFINIAGLAIGIACCMLIVQFIRIELNYDKHHENGDQLYRVTTEFHLGDRDQKLAVTPSPFAKALVADFPEVVAAARLLQAPSVDKFLIKHDDKAHFEEKGYYVDSTFFEVLTYDFVSGDPGSALDQPFTIVISKEIAEKIFGTNDPLDQIEEWLNNSGGGEAEDDCSLIVYSFANPGLTGGCSAGIILV